MKIGTEFFLGTILVPAVATAFISIANLQKADAVQETRIDQLIKITEEIRTDVKDLKKGE